MRAPPEGDGAGDVTGIVEFLNARYDELEAAAKAASPGRWRLIESMRNQLREWIIGVGSDWGVSTILATYSLDAAVFVVGNSPEFVLADIASKRAIVADCEKAVATARKLYGDDESRYSPWSKIALRTLKRLAAPFSGHPDYTPSWTIDA